MLGWTGEGSLTPVARRKEWAEAVLRASNGRMLIAVHVGYGTEADAIVKEIEAGRGARPLQKASMTTKTTLQHVAEAAGVSIGTVSNVLNGRSKENYPKVAERAKRIRALAEKMEYRPNSAAKVMRSGRFGNVAYVWQRDWLYAPKALLRGLARRLADLEMHLSMAELPHPADEDQRVPKLMRELATDGLLVDRTITFTAEQMAMIERCRVPVVWLNADTETDCSYPDDHGAAVAAVEMLRGLGHRRIAYFQQMRGHHYSYRVREQGYLDAMAAAGLAPRSLVARKKGARWDDEHIIEDLHALIREFKPTAMLCFGELGANAAMVAAARQGLRVPENLSIVVHHPGSAWVGGLPATTMLSDFMEVGVQAVNMLRAKLEHGQPMPSCAVPHGVVEGQTVAPHREGA